LNKIDLLDPPFEIPGYQVRLLGPDDITALQALLERCADYSQLVIGESPRPEAAQSLLTDCPPGRTSADKAVIGIYNAEQSLVGVLDAIGEYPSEGCWWVGLLLLEPLERHQGLGRRFYQAFEHWVSQLGAENILLGVIEENENASRFWQGLGFEVIEKQPPRRVGDKEHIIITMVHYLSQVKNV
jgi:GNAT superfamily N-acetyltransferase